MSRPWVNLCREYCEAQHVAASSQSTYLFHVRLVRLALGREPVADDFQRETINRVLIWAESHYAQRTVAGLRGSIATAWRWCYERSYTGPPQQIRREKKPAPMPIAWTVLEYHLVLDAACRLAGTWCHTPAALWFSGLVRVAYETGLRAGNVMALEQSDFCDDGTVYVRQRKTGEPIVRAVTLDTLALVRQIDRNPVFRVYDERSMYARLREVVAAAGVRPGALQMLRRTGATAVAARDGEDAASDYLGHTDPTTRKFYLDRSQLVQRPVIPPQ